jgi:hypothetical protein
MPPWREMQDSSKKRTGMAHFLDSTRVQILNTGRHVQHSKILLDYIRNLEESAHLVEAI